MAQARLRGLRFAGLSYPALEDSACLRQIDFAHPARAYLGDDAVVR